MHVCLHCLEAATKCLLYPSFIGETFITSTFSSRRYFMQVIRDYRFYCFILLFVAVVFAYNGLIPMTRKFLLPIAKQQTQTYESLEVSGKGIIIIGYNYRILFTDIEVYGIQKILNPDNFYTKYSSQ